MGSAGDIHKHVFWLKIDRAKTLAEVPSLFDDDSIDAEVYVVVELDHEMLGQTGVVRAGQVVSWNETFAAKCACAPKISVQLFSRGVDGKTTLIGEVKTNGTDLIPNEQNDE